MRPETKINSKDEVEKEKEKNNIELLLEKFSIHKSQRQSTSLRFSQDHNGIFVTYDAIPLFDVKNKLKDCGLELFDTDTLPPQSERGFHRVYKFVYITDASKFEAALASYKEEKLHAPPPTPPIPPTHRRQKANFIVPGDRSETLALANKNRADAGTALDNKEEIKPGNKGP